MRKTTAIAMLVTALALTGCGALPGIGPDPRVPAEPIAAVSCPAVYDDDIVSGLVPDGFEAVAVLRCDPYASRDDEDGTWSGVTLERLEGDLEPVLSALAVPSDPLSPGPCPAIGYLIPELWIEGTDGTVVRVDIPTDGCAAPKSVGLDAALDALTTVEETFQGGGLIESTAARNAGCDTLATFLVLAGADDIDAGIPARPDSEQQTLGDDMLIPFEMPGWPETSAVSGARICDYRSTADTSSSVMFPDDAAAFVGVRELGIDDARALVAAARTATAAASCGETATRLVTVHLQLTSGESARAFTVELDGCRRVVAPDLRGLAAPPALLAALTPA
ncbi:MAG: hypothetical protein P0Y60_12015 [Candidatus Microbacterium colombiense]|nr:MAG: hypothetical protein P0Y60_12015 [Microbacterium sp.]